MVSGRGKFAKLAGNQCLRAMEKRKSSSSKRNSLITNFRELKASSPSLAQTGPKRPRRPFALTPTQPKKTTRKSSHGGGRSSHLLSPGGKRGSGHVTKDFLDLRNSSLSLAQTGPKRQKDRGFVLSPVHTSPPLARVARSGKSSLSSGSSKGTHKRRSRVSFEKLVSVQEFGGDDDAGAGLKQVSNSDEATTSSDEAGHPTASSDEAGTSRTSNDEAAPIPTVSLISTADLSSATNTTANAPHLDKHRSRSRAGVSNDDLEPMDTEEEEEGEEPRLATPNIKDMASFHGADSFEDTLGSTDSRPVKRKRGRPRKVVEPVQQKRRPGRPRKDTVPTKNIDESVKRKRGRPRKGTEAVKSPQMPKTLSRGLIKNLFSLYSKKRLTRGAMDLVMKFSEQYLKQATQDLCAYSKHARRKAITLEDVVLLLKRQRAIKGDKTFEFLVHKYLPMEYCEILLPCNLMPSSER